MRNEQPELLVYWHGGDEEDSRPFHVTATFDEQGGKTRLSMRTLFESAAELDKTVKFGAIEGGKQTLARLAEHLTKM